MRLRQADPDIAASPAFLLAQGANGNAVINNVLINNGKSPGASNPFGFAAADLTFLWLGQGEPSCFSGNVFDTAFSTVGSLLVCP